MNLVNDIPTTQDDYEHINCIVEIPKGTNTKYEYDENLNVFKLDRCLVSSLQYPINYGFVPQTVALDDDPLDVLIFKHDISTSILDMGQGRGRGAPTCDRYRYVPHGQTCQAV